MTPPELLTLHLTSIMCLKVLLVTVVITFWVLIGKMTMVARRLESGLPDYQDVPNSDSIGFDLENSNQ